MVLLLILIVAFVVALLMKSRHSILKRMTLVSSWISMALMAAGFLIIAGCILLRSIKPSSNSDEWAGEHWFYTGLGYFTLGGLAQLIPIFLGLIDKQIGRGKIPE